MPAPLPPRLDALTGIRFLAALAVFFSHLSAVPTSFEPLRTFQAAGYNGVTLFFILSGFIIAWNYEGKFRREPLGRVTTSFAIARFARIYPLYIGALVLAALFAGGWQQIVADPAWWLSLLALQTWSPDAAIAFSYNSPGWSIGVEFFLYASFPFIFLALRPIRTARKALVAVAVGAIAVSFTLALIFTMTGAADLPWDDPASAHRWLYRTPLTRLPDFILGVALAYLGASHTRSRPNMGMAMQVAGFASIVTLMAWPALLYNAFSWDAAYMIPTGLVIYGLATAPTTWIGRVLSHPTALLLGEASYAFYLLHAVILTAVPAAADAAPVAWIARSAWLLVIVVIASVGAHILVEKPARQFIRSLDRRRADPDAGSPTAPRQGAR